MARADALYKWLAQVPPPHAERILAAALAHAEPPYRQRITEQLLERATDEAYAGLVANYECLPPDVQQHLWTDRDRLRVGLALALGASQPRTRCNALAALRDHPWPTLSYLLPDALRHPSDEVRRAAGETLRRTAQLVADEVPGDDWDDARQQEYAAGRAETAKAVWEALRTFDLHYRTEAIEISLWFARDFANDLWQVLGNRRSECGNVASNRLASWNSPRLARFLLEALTHSAWRISAQRILQKWTSRAQLVAILRNTDLLASRDIRRQLNGFKTSAWFHESGDRLSALPTNMRALAPRWVCHLGFSPELKVSMLSKWLGSDSADVQRACSYALAWLDTPAVIPHLAAVAEGPSAQATFARWWVIGKRERAVRSTAGPARTPAAPILDIPSSEDFAALWQECRRRSSAQDVELLAILRVNLKTWGPLVAERLNSPDPHDRLLGLRIIADGNLAERFPRELAALINDPVPSVRRLATAIAGTAPAAGPPKPDPTTLRRELRQTMACLLSGQGDAKVTAEQAQHVRSLLQQLSAPRTDAPEPNTMEPEACP